tara:strand:- start:2242 stop:2484 length:243 start_codon:yes stop_codon:yes gene_type:complete
MIYKYFKYLIFYFLLLVESLLNFCASTIAYYPTLDWSTAFLAWFEIRRVGSFVKSRKNRRDKLKTKADSKMREAKEVDDG